MHNNVEDVLNPFLADGLHSMWGICLCHFTGCSLKRKKNKARHKEG